MYTLTHICTLSYIEIYMHPCTLTHTHSHPHIPHPLTNPHTLHLHTHSYRSHTHAHTIHHIALHLGPQNTHHHLVSPCPWFHHLITIGLVHQDIISNRTGAWSDLFSVSSSTSRTFPTMWQVLNEHVLDDERGFILNKVQRLYQ